MNSFTKNSIPLLKDFEDLPDTDEFSLMLKVEAARNEIKFRQSRIVGLQLYIDKLKKKIEENKVDSRLSAQTSMSDSASIIRSNPSILKTFLPHQELPASAQISTHEIGVNTESSSLDFFFLGSMVTPSLEASIPLPPSVVGSEKKTLSISKIWGSLKQSIKSTSKNISRVNLTTFHQSNSKICNKKATTYRRFMRFVDWFSKGSSQVYFSV
ncbi:hypothetical protein HMI55_006285 [Coelomomyces lativittatus]|nr:hypothetical protein HMI55_006285 [Coelomomyces lativittatus]